MRPRLCQFSERHQLWLSQGGGDRGSTAARPTQPRDLGGPQVRDPVPIVSVNPEADPPQPRAPGRPNRARRRDSRREKPGVQKRRQKPPEEPGGVGDGTGIFLIYSRLGMVGGLTRIQDGMRSWSGKRERESALFKDSLARGEREREFGTLFLFEKNRSHWEVLVFEGKPSTSWPGFQ